MNRILLVLVAATLAAVPLRAQAAFRVFGQACTAPGEATPAIQASRRPQVGTQFDVIYAGPNRVASGAQQFVQPFLVTGLGTLPTPVTVPSNLFPQQPQGCTLLVQPDLVMAMPIDGSGMAYQTAVTFAIPNDPRVIGVSWYHQWFAILTQCGFAGCGPAWAIVSPAAQVVVGP